MLTPLLQRLGSVLDEAGAAWSVVHEEPGPQIDDVTLHVAPGADTDSPSTPSTAAASPRSDRNAEHLAPDGPRWLRVRLDTGQQTRRRAKARAD